jgi:glycine oxidase
MSVVAVSRVAIVGDGIVGMATAVVAASLKIPVTLFAPELPGGASPASAGMLAPSVERSSGHAQEFSDAARDAWPRLATLLDRLGEGPVDVRRNGILQLASTAEDVARLKSLLRGDDQWLGPDEVLALEPEVASSILGAARFPRDGVVDAPGAVAALRRICRDHPLIQRVPLAVSGVDVAGTNLGVRTADGVLMHFEVVVLAAGAWSALIPGLPRAVHVTPLRGTLVSVDAPLVREPIYGPGGHCYLLPRHGRTVIGATSDAVGFDFAPGPTDQNALIDAAARLVPAVRRAPVIHLWTGLRPMSADGTPLIGPDPDVPGLLYACGHGRNGFLQAALTAEVVSAHIIRHLT